MNRLLLLASAFRFTSACLEFMQNPHPPAAAVCDGQGTLSNPKILARIRGLTGEGCLTRCQHRKQCKSIELSGIEEQVCTLFSAPIEDMGYQNQSTSHNLLLDRTCYLCYIKECEVGQDLIKNGGFNHQTINPWVASTPGDTTTNINSTTTGPDGTTAFEAIVQFVNDGDDYVDLFQEFQSCRPNGSQYELTFQYRFTQGLSDVSIFIEVFEFSDSIAGDPSTAGMWQNYTSSPTITSSRFEIGELSFDIDSADAAQETVAIDNVVFKYLGAGIP